MSRRRLALLLLCLGLSGPLAGQTSGLPGDRLGFDQPADLLADAQGYVYTAYLDGALTGTRLTATCTGTVSPWGCVAVLPPLVTGTHTVQLTASVVLADGRAAESTKSPLFTFRLFAAPTAPTTVRIVPGPA